MCWYTSLSLITSLPPPQCITACHTAYVYTQFMSCVIITSALHIIINSTDTENVYKPAYDVTVVRMVLQCWSMLGVLKLLLFSIPSMWEDPEVIYLNFVTICRHTIIFIVLLFPILPQHATKSTNHHCTFNAQCAGLPDPTHVTRNQ
jgi:hypothetical protein